MDNEQLIVTNGQLIIEIEKLNIEERKLNIKNGKLITEIREQKMENDQMIAAKEERKIENEQKKFNNGMFKKDRARLRSLGSPLSIRHYAFRALRSKFRALRPAFRIPRPAAFLLVPHSRLAALVFTFYLLLFTFTSAFAQDSPSVKTTIDRTHILIGEQVRLGIDVSYPTGESVLLPQPDSIPHFAMVGKGSVDSLVTGNSTSYHLEWKLTSFDSGVNKIPAFPIIIGNGHYYSDSLLVDVSYGDLDSAKEYHDIKGIIDIENPAVKYISWAVIGLTVLSMILFIWSSTRPLARTDKPKATNPVGLSPFDEAMASLESLRKLALTDAATVKKYYSGMNDALRIYLSRSMGLATMERTNEELIFQLSLLEINKDFFTQLAGTLRMSDFVKFAKYIPGSNDNDRNLVVIHSAIVLINETQKNSVKRLVQ